MRAGYFSGYGDALLEQRVSDLETNQETQAASIQALNDASVVAYRLSAVGAGAGAAVAAGATVRFALPALSERFPDDARWNRLASGVWEYDGTLEGIYEAHCPVAFGTSLAVLVSYTWMLAEGTGLDTGSPVIRDSVAFTIERQLVGGNATAVPTGPLTLQGTGGQIALFASHSSGLSVTLTPATIALFLTRVSALETP